MEGEIKELQLNVAYGTAICNQNVYDIPSCQDSVPKGNKTAIKTKEKKSCCTIAIAS